MSTATLTFRDPNDNGRVEITLDFDPPLSHDKPAPYTHAMAAMALQYAREKFAEEMDE